MRRYKIVPAVLVLSLLSFGCGWAHMSSPAEETTRSFFALHTQAAMQAYGTGAATALAEAQAYIQQLERRVSATDESSEIYAVNHSGGASTIISMDTEELISLALWAARSTGGAIDPTMEPVQGAWREARAIHQVPTPEQLDRRMQDVGYQGIYLEGISVTLPAGAQLNLGGVDKGFALKKAAEVLRRYGVESALLALGGHVQAIGGNPDGGRWRIGVQDPFSDQPLGILEVEDQAVMTSGPEEPDGPLLDPATGYPAQSGLACVTVVGSDGGLCDALSAALFVMGREQAEAYWRRSGGFEMLLVTQDGEVLVTQGLKDSFLLRDGVTPQTVQTISP